MTPTRPTSSPRSRGAGTSGAGSWRLTCKASARVDLPWFGATIEARPRAGPRWCERDDPASEGRVRSGGARVARRHALALRAGVLRPARDDAGRGIADLGAVW